MVKSEVKKQNTTQEWLSKKAGISYETLRSWISKGILPRVDKAYSISDALGVKLEYLMVGQELDSATSPIRKAFQEFVDMSTDDELQKMWDFFELMRGKK